MTARQPRPAGVDGDVVGSRRAAEILGVDERTIVRWSDDGALPVAYRTRGGHRRYLTRELATFTNPDRKAPA